jgi:hypothetical protein
VGLGELRRKLKRAGKHLTQVHGHALGERTLIGAAVDQGLHLCNEGVEGRADCWRFIHCVILS